MIQYIYIYIYIKYGKWREFRLPIITIESCKDSTALLRLLINYYIQGPGTTHRYYIQELRRSYSSLRGKLPALMAEGPRKALGDVTPPSGEDEEEEKEVTLDFDEDALTGERNAAFS